MAEQWLPVVGYEGLYEVSDQGRIKSIRRSGAHGGILKPYINRRGYVELLLCKNGTKKYARLHRLILRAFVGPCPKDQDGCHNNGTPFDNRLTNIRWDTKKANSADARTHDRLYRPRGTLNWSTKLTERIVKNIRKRVAAGAVQRQLAKELGVSPAIICNIVNRKNWTHI